MKNGFKKWLVASFCGCASLLVSCASTGRLQLPERAQQSFEEYQSTPRFRDFKAFAVDPSSGGWGYAWGYSNSKGAIDQALRECRKVGQACEVYAVGNTVVSGLPPEQVTAVIAGYIATVSPANARFLGDVKKRAEQGDSRVQFLLGRAYENGWWDIPKDLNEAWKWYLRASAKEHAEAQYKVGLMYVHGLGVPQSNSEAYMWFTLATSQGVGHAATKRDEIAKKMTPAQISEAQRLAREWKPTRQ